MKHKHFLSQIFSIALLAMALINSSAQERVNSDYWSATDALGRSTPEWFETSEPREGKYIAIFYHTWHTDHHADFDPVMNLTEILADSPEAINDWDHPAWQGNNATTGGVFTWDEPLFGYYRTTDEWVLRKHAEMLADAGVDVVVFDASNGGVTWKSSYMKLLEVWNQAREDGVKAPQVAFMLTLFPPEAVSGGLVGIYELYKDLYKPGLYSDQWFMWKGKPFIMAYPEILEDFPTEDVAGMKFTASASFTNIDVNCPSWANNIGNLTLSLYTWEGDYASSVSGDPLASQTHEDFTDNAFLGVGFPELGPGEYVWELTEASEVVGVWKYPEDTDTITSYFNGIEVSGDYIARINYTTGGYTSMTAGASNEPVQINGGFDQVKIDAIKEFFTFRPGQPDYVNGPSRDDQWGWLETYPQHGYVGNETDGYEQTTVGVAQNANSVSGGHCCSFNAPDTYGRSYTKTNGRDTRENAYLWGANIEEQWGRAMEIDPEVVWVTGWNEWLIARWRNWAGCAGGVQVENSFMDGFDAERSRDIEPVKSWGEYGDAYYLQLVSQVRRFKGMERQDSASRPTTIQIGSSDGWNDVKPEFRHYKGNTLERNHPGKGQSIVYTNTTGRNDIVLAKVARDNDFVYFYVETDGALSPVTDYGWMRLFIDIDRDKQSGWEGYDFMINRVTPGAKALLEKNVGGDWVWTKADSVEYAITDTVLELKIPRSSLGLAPEDEVVFEFKWSDNMLEEGNIMDFYVNGDVAPGGRFNFVYNTDRTTGAEPVTPVMETHLNLRNYPNPFSDETTFEFNLKEGEDASLAIFNSTGQQLRLLPLDNRSSGTNRITWDGCDESGNPANPGLYFCRLVAGNGVGSVCSVLRIR
ncbi:MAG: FlgD immunoglobulin-like domain containing protein [Bacteroidota bacterium]